MADIRDYLKQRQISKGPRRKKRAGEPLSLWNSPTSAAQKERATEPTLEKNQEIRLSTDCKTSSSETLESDLTQDSIREEVLRPGAVPEVLTIINEPPADLGIKDPVSKTSSSDDSPIKMIADGDEKLRAGAVSSFGPLEASQDYPDEAIGVSNRVIVPPKKTRKRLPPVTVGRAPVLPPIPTQVDLSKDEKFLARYWFDPQQGGLPRSQERFFHFYRFLYTEAARTRCARVFCTEEMAIKEFGPKARGTFSNYRKLGQRYGMFSVYVVGNLGRGEHKPGTYFFLRDPWNSQ